MKNWINLVLVIIIVIVAVVWLTALMGEIKPKSAESPQVLRFQEKEAFHFGEGMKGKIFIDAETDIEYLYIWCGYGNGGPAMTRLWKENE